MHPGRPSSSTAQHVINMAAMDPGLGIGGSIGSTSVGESSNNSSGGSHTMVPGSYRNTHSHHYHQHQAPHSPRLQGNLSPQSMQQQQQYSANQSLNSSTRYIISASSSMGLNLVEALVFDCSDGDYVIYTDYDLPVVNGA